MSKTFKILAAFGLVVYVAACAPKEEEFVVVDPEPISTEPTYSGKYK